MVKGARYGFSARASADIGSTVCVWESIMPRRVPRVGGHKIIFFCPRHMPKQLYNYVLDLLSFLDLLSLFVD